MRFDNENSLRQIIVFSALILVHTRSVFAVDINPLTINIPESSKGPKVPVETGYFVSEIKDGIYWVTNGAYQSMFMTTGHGIVVVDAPPSIGQNLLRAIKDVSDEHITHMIYSHSHKDHIGAAALLPGHFKSSPRSRYERYYLLPRIQTVHCPQ
ncbi:MAG: MBL fold metallo-hydrolase [Oceanicoccus sp.]